MLKEVHTNKIANKISLTDFEVQFSQCFTLFCYFYYAFVYLTFFREMLFSFVI